jgi:hypothetical protein
LGHLSMILDICQLYTADFSKLPVHFILTLQFFL